MAGRKKIPTKLKMIKGTFRKERENKNEPFPDDNIPEPPDFLSEEALAEWNRITPELYANGLITNLDRALLAMYCQAWARVVEYEKIVANGLELYETEKGGKQMSPAMWVLNKAKEQVYKYATEFGMSAQSRSKVTANKSKKKKDPWEKFGP